MSLSNNQNNHLTKASLKLIRQCPVCEVKYDLSGVQILDRTENAFMVYFRCQMCKSSLIASIIEMPFGLLGSGLLTDLAPQEVLKFDRTEAITEDNVLEVYKLLERGKDFLNYSK